MLKYKLEYRVAGAGEQTLDFYARSLNGALDVAKAEAKGNWARLYEEDRPICDLELIEDSGVWLVGKSKAAGSQYHE
ncbi:hypothetical protein [Qipengyuania oceanensis]|uniref:Uncharacterized protein n=1 Tax=Qipengyuania oceanensis TaxID=1463597 RepID=A0A844YIY6_9SPHN|nr:hypothetical protein [Qipengyuania oceanensis]MXO64091.1 hypothetical protein [Qipengyuania oceanensis]